MRVRVPYVLVVLGLFPFLLIERMSEYGILCKFMYIWRLLCVRWAMIISERSDVNVLIQNGANSFVGWTRTEMLLWKEELKCCVWMVSNWRKIMLAFGWHRWKMHRTVKVLILDVRILISYAKQPGILSNELSMCCFPAVAGCTFYF